MGRKGISTRKPKKLKQPAALTTNSGSSPIQSLIKDKGVPAQHETSKTPGAWNKKKKGH